MLFLRSWIEFLKDFSYDNQFKIKLKLFGTFYQQIFVIPKKIAYFMK